MAGTSTSSSSSSTSNAAAPGSTPVGFFADAEKDAYVRGVDIAAVKKQAAREDWREFEAFVKDVEVVGIS